MSRPVRNIVGIFLIILGIIGTLLPIMPGFVFFGAAVGVLGTDHAIVRWAQKHLRRFGVMKPKPEEPSSTAPAAENPPGDPPLT
jgi:hypothetical protein